MKKLDNLVEKYMNVIQEKAATGLEKENLDYLDEFGFWKHNYGGRIVPGSKFKWIKNLSDDDDEEHNIYICAEEREKGFYAALVIDEKIFADTVSYDGKVQTAVEQLKKEAMALAFKIKEKMSWIY